MSAGTVLWTWQFVDASGIAVGETAPDASTRFDAEAWLGEHWRAIARRGAARGVLLRAGEPFGPGVDLRDYEL